MSTPICPYCSRPAKLVGGAAIHPHRPDLASKKFWRCDPCDAHVGCHKRADGTEPFGTLANAELRKWRHNAHKVFDPFWHGRTSQARTIAYARLAFDLGIEVQNCHISLFDVEQCKRVIDTVNNWST